MALMVLKINYSKRGKSLSQQLNVDFGDITPEVNFATLKKSLRKIKSINSVHLFKYAVNKEDYSLLDNTKLIDEVLLFIKSIYHTFSLVIKQNDNGEKVIIYFYCGVYDYTEINCANKTFTSYLSIKESIELAKKAFSNVIM